MGKLSAIKHIPEPRREFFENDAAYRYFLDLTRVLKELQVGAADDVGGFADVKIGKTIGDVPQYEDDGSSNPVLDHPNMPLVGGAEIVDKSAGNINTIHQFLASEYIELASNVSGGPFNEDVSANVPSDAKGALVKIIINPDPASSGSLVIADRQGNFGTVNHYLENAFTNYIPDWAGSMLFAPFYTGKTLKWKTKSNASDPDTNVSAYMSLIGWWK